MIDYIEVIGLIAGALGMVGNVPQAIKVVRTRQTEDLSLATFATISLAAIAWFTYGCLIGSFSLVLTNIIVFACTATISVVKIIEDKKHKKKC